MDAIRSIALAILQGLTEFLPISSSGHLVLMPVFLDWPDQGLAFDIAVHFGSLLAVMFYFRTDLVMMLRCIGKPSSPDGRLAWQLVAATVPLGLGGLLLADIVENELRSAGVIALTTVVFGILLWVADWRGKRTGDEHAMSWRAAVLIGLAQVLALIPGTSRSGITMTAGLALGLTREAAGRFSFLLSIPAIMMAAGWSALQLLGSDAGNLAWGQLFLAAGVAAGVAFSVIVLFLRLIGRIGMVWFALYRILLGALILIVLIR